MKRLLALTAALLTFSSAPPASAGEYKVKACFSDPRLGPTGNASWFADTPFTPYVTTYTVCPGEGIVTRMSGGSGNAPYGAGARHAFTAPPGTRIKNVSANIKINAEHGWYAGFVDSTPRWIWCGNALQQLRVSTGPSSVAANTSRLFAQVTCGNGGGCPRAAQYGIVAMRDVEVTVEDNDAPERRDNRRFGHRAGLAPRGSERAVLGMGCDRHTVGRVLSRRRGAGSSDGQLRLGAWHGHVQTTSGTMALSARAFGADGRHTRHGQSARRRPATGPRRRGPYSSTGRLPAKPLDVATRRRRRLAGATTASRVGWRNPPQTASPIAAARYSHLPCVQHRLATSANVPRGCTRPRHLVGPGAPRAGARRVAAQRSGSRTRPATRTASARCTAGVLRFDDDTPTLRIAAAGGRGSDASPGRRERRHVGDRRRPGRGAKTRARTHGDRFRRRLGTGRVLGDPRRRGASAWALRAACARRRPRGQRAIDAGETERRAGGRERCRCASPRGWRWASRQRVRARDANGQVAVPDRAAGESARPLRTHDPAARPAHDARARTRSQTRTSRYGSA